MSVYNAKKNVRFIFLCLTNYFNDDCNHQFIFCEAAEPFRLVKNLVKISFVSVLSWCKSYWSVTHMLYATNVYLLQAEVFPFPEIGNEELEEINQLVAPVERFFNEEGVKNELMNTRDQ